GHGPSGCPQNRLAQGCELQRVGRQAIWALRHSVAIRSEAKPHQHHHTAQCGFAADKPTASGKRQQGRTANLQGRNHKRGANIPPCVAKRGNLVHPTTPLRTRLASAFLALFAVDGFAVAVNTRAKPNSASSSTDNFSW